jgi:hypothetical protein
MWTGLTQCHHGPGTNRVESFVAVHRKKIFAHACLLILNWSYCRIPSMFPKQQRQRSWLDNSYVNNIYNIWSTTRHRPSLVMTNTAATYTHTNMWLDLMARLSTGSCVDVKSTFNKFLQIRHFTKTIILIFTPGMRILPLFVHICALR